MKTKTVDFSPNARNVIVSVRNKGLVCRCRNKTNKLKRLCWCLCVLLAVGWSGCSKPASELQGQKPQQTSQAGSTPVQTTQPSRQRKASDLKVRTRTVEPKKTPERETTGKHTNAQDKKPVTSAKMTKQDHVNLLLVDRQAYDRLLQRFRGKVVLVDFWATWCLPCVENFPHTVEWFRKYADKGLQCVSVSFDDPDENGTNRRVLEFLKQQGATFTNLLSKYGADAESFNAFRLDAGGIPCYKLYDRQGRLVRIFSNNDPDHPLDPAEIEQAILQELDRAEEVNNKEHSK